MTIALRSALELKTLTENRWELFFDTGELFSTTTPFRDYLEQVRVALAQKSPAELDLPPPEGDDDCVEGRLRWEGQTLAIYFERALSYFTLTGAHEPTMRRALDVIRPIVSVA